MARQYETVKRYYSDQEIETMKNQLVTSVGEVRDLRGQKSETTTTLGAAIKSAEKAVFDLQQQIETGYESVEVEVVALFDTPVPGRKRIIRTDTNEPLREEDMTNRERQAQLGFEE
jgi:hypothetical protein